MASKAKGKPQKAFVKLLAKDKRRGDDRSLRMGNAGEAMMALEVGGIASLLAEDLPWFFEGDLSAHHLLMAVSVAWNSGLRSGERRRGDRRPHQ
jgi:hypothetical protein